MRFIVLFLSCFFGSPAYAESTAPLYEAVDHDTVTIVPNPKRVFFEHFIVFPVNYVISQYEINCKNQTIFLHGLRAGKYKEQSTFIKNETEKPKVLFKSDPFYDVYQNYCSK